MAQGDVVVTVIGNLTGDPELRFTPNGQAVASFTVASTTRMLDKATNEWKDGDTLFLRCSGWRHETKEGEKRTVVEMDVDDVGPALRNATAKVNRVARTDSGYNGGGAAAPSEDPWAAPAPAGDEPPF